MTTICERCDEPREVTRIRKETKYCQTCRMAIRREALNVAGWESRPTAVNGRKMHEYKRVCSCGDEKWVKYIPEPGAQCMKCSSSKLGYAMSQNNIKEESEKVRYKRVCSNPECRKVDYITANPEKYRKTSLCGKCSSSARGKLNKGGSKKKDKKVIKVKKIKVPIRHFRVCPDCEPEVACVEVSSVARSGIRYCIKHKKQPSGKDRKQSKPYVKKIPSKTKEVSEAAIERVRKINKEHREAVSNHIIKKPKLITQTKTDDEMMAEFLKTNQPTVIQSSYIEQFGQTDCSRLG